MPSARAAAIAGAMMRSSSSPNRPPSPACGFSPATAIRGVASPRRAALRWAIRSVCSTASNVTASIARRSDMWIVTSTVRSSSLASIMRTGGGTAPCAASACSISVWPGWAMPAAARASLWIGAVTIAPTSPALTSATARAMHAAAAAPARASICPTLAASRSAGRPSICSTGTQFGGTSNASAACATRATASMPPVHAAARRSTATSPSTTQPAACAPRNSLAMISGPMPHASPIVRASGTRRLRSGAWVMPALSRLAAAPARRGDHRR